MIYSCQKEAHLDTDQNQAPTEGLDSKPIVLGKALNMPYTAKNMQTALDNLLTGLKGRSKNSKLAKTFKDGEGIEVLPSHYYYRFLPKDSLEHELITNDTILQVSNIPLHYEVEEQGDFYDDPELEGDENPGPFSYLYAVVPYDYPIPENVYGERLDDFYFAPEMDDKEALQEGEVFVKQPRNSTTKEILSVDENGEVFEYLELEALKLTNNLDEDELAALQFYLPEDTSGKLYSYEEAVQLGYEQKQLIMDLASVEAMLAAEAGEQARRRKWSPSGRITVQEDAIGRAVGVVGAEVKVRKWGFLVIRRARTNNTGNFRARSTRTKRVKYAVHFNGNGRFKVKAGSIFIDAKHRGTRTYKRKPWNQHFSWGRSQFYALVHNAAYDYYTNAVPRYGLHRPNYNLRIKAEYSKSESSEHRAAISGLMPISDIKVTRIRKGSYRGSDGIYATTVHELTHRGHRNMDPGMFSVVANSCRKDMMIESWAEGVETILTNDRYDRFDNNYFRDTRTVFEGWNEARQRQTIQTMNEYTPIVIDLVDRANQNLLPNTPGNQPVDNVENYTLQQIQSALDKSRNFTNWRNKLNANRPPGLTTAELTELFSYLNQVRQNPQTCD